MVIDAERDEAHWTTTSERLVLDGRVRMVERVAVLPDGSTIEYVVDTSMPFAVAALIVVDGEVLLSRQYRYPINRWILDLPAGGGQHGEEPIVASRREVEEELGLVPVDLVPLHTFFANPGRSVWRVHVFFGTTVEPGHAKTDDAAEQVRLVRMPIEELDVRIAAGEIVDPTLLIARAMAAAAGVLPPLGHLSSA